MINKNELTAFIPAAGFGTRMGKICENNQKCMLKIFDENKPILHYIIDNLSKVGCKNIVIAVNFCKEEIINYFKDGKEYGVNITYSIGDFKSTYDTLIKSLSVLPDTFIYSHGDMIFKKEVYTSLIDNYNKYHKSVIAIMPNTYHKMTHPRISIKDNNVDEIVFKDNLDKYKYMYLGCAIYNKSDFIDNYNLDNTGMVEKMIIDKLNKKEEVKAIIYLDKWRHFMNEYDLKVAKEEKNWLIN